MDRSASGIQKPFSRRRFLQVGSGLLGLSLPDFLKLRARAGTLSERPARSCIVLFCWGGMSHLDTWDMKPEAPTEVRGQFKPIPTDTIGIQISEHLPFLSQRTKHLAIVRSVHHSCTAHGKGMYWNLTGHQPVQPRAAINRTPSREDWPSLASIVGALKDSPEGMPQSVSLPYPLVDDNILQAGERGGWLGPAHDPVIVRTPAGKPFGGVSRDLGSPVLKFEGADRVAELQKRRALLEQLQSATAPVPSTQRFQQFHEKALDILLTPKVRAAFDLDQEPYGLRQRYGNHICGQSMLLARRLIEAGSPIVNVICAAGDLNGAKGDHWDTHANNFSRLKDTMLPVFDRAASALIDDLDQRGLLDETLILMIGDFGRTPKVIKGAGRDHYPFCYSVVFAGGGIRGGQVYGSSDKQAAHPDQFPCGPNDIHATVFRALGIPLKTQLHDQLNRPHIITNGQPLPLFPRS